MYLDEVKSLAPKLQKRDKDIYEAYNTVDTVIDRVKATIDTTFSAWYDSSVLLRVFPGKQASKGMYRSNTPSAFPQEHYKRVVSIPLLDSFIRQLKERFKGDEH